MPFLMPTPFSRLLQHAEDKLGLFLTTRTHTAGLRERMEDLGLKEQDAQDRHKWRRGIMATDPQVGDKV